jgi:hypothetical protein
LDNQKSNGVKLKDLLDGITDSINN